MVAEELGQLCELSPVSGSVGLCYGRCSPLGRATCRRTSGIPTQACRPARSCWQDGWCRLFPASKRPPQQCCDVEPCRPSGKLLRLRCSPCRGQCSCLCDQAGLGWITGQQYPLTDLREVLLPPPVPQGPGYTVQRVQQSVAPDLPGRYIPNNTCRQCRLLGTPAFPLLPFRRLACLDYSLHPVSQSSAWWEKLPRGACG